jgi:putative ABC transport system substrate-binding protein
MKNKRIFLHFWKVIFVVLAFALSGCGLSAQPKVYKVGILSGLNFIADGTAGFKEGMAELGYVEGENITYDVQETDFDMEAYRSILQKFVADKVDLIVAFPTEASFEAKLATEGTDIPVLFTYSNIEGMGLVDSVSKPGGNVTGVRYPGPGVAVKRLEILVQLVPDAKNIWMPYQRGYPIIPPELEEIYPVAANLGVNLIEFPADNAAELEAEFSRLEASGEIGFDAILMLVEPIAVTPDSFMVMAKFASENNIPMGGATVIIDEYATLFGVDVLSFDSAKQGAAMADKIFNGIDPAELPVESADTYLRINSIVAQDLGLEVPYSLLQQADEIIR